MKVVTWNVNSIRSRMERLTDYLGREQPCVVALQELKCQEEVYPFQDLEDCGYQSLVQGQKTYNGVALLVKEGLSHELVESSINPADQEARYIHGRIEGTDIISIYAPNGRSTSDPQFRYKLAWYDNLIKKMEAFDLSRDCVLLLGDYNIAPEDKDCYDPEGFYEETLVSTPERLKLKKLMALGFSDLYRELNGEEVGYTWWDYRQLGFQKNKGLRIDHILASEPMKARATGCFVARDERRMPKDKQKPSDHAPVVATFRSASS